MAETHIEVVGVIGDVHSQDTTLRVALDFLAANSCLDKLLCTGDILDGEGSAEACCQLLQAAGVLTVRGNHERWFFETEPFAAELVQQAQPEDLDTWPIPLSETARAYLAALPPTREFQTPRGNLLLCHGLGSDDMAGVFPGDGQHALEANRALWGLVKQARYRFVINGHTHQRMVRQIGPVTIINAGTLLQAPEANCAIADFKQGRVEFFRITEGAGIRRDRTYPLP